MLKGLFYPGGVDWNTLFIPDIFHEIYYDGIYLDVMNNIDHNVKDAVIVDAGANIGIVTHYMIPHAKVIHAVEPSSLNYEALEKNKEFNHWDNVKLHKFAFADKDGEMQLREYTKNHTSNSLVLRDVDDTTFENVPTKKLTTFFDENDIKHVDFMKFDVEGAEELIFPTPDFVEASKIIDNILVEFHLPNFPEHVNRLIKLGYKARRYTCSAVVVDFAK